MTLTYTAEVATCKGFGCFLQLLRRWRASVYKLIWMDLMVFLSIFYIITYTYQKLLNNEQQKMFEYTVGYCKDHSNQIPLSFILGFYVALVMKRWWNQYLLIPSTASMAIIVSSTMHGQDERGRLMRRTIMRYAYLCQAAVLSNISPQVKKRFPTLEHFVSAGFLLDNERSIIEDLNKKFPKPSKYWISIVWASSIVIRARKEGRIRDDYAVKTLIDELNKLRDSARNLTNYDYISIPLVYTQVVTLATYTYFLAAVMGTQWLKNHPSTSIDRYFPLFTTLQLFFYMGWLKVAETLINPFGEDDEDFDVYGIIDRSLQTSYLIVDEMHSEHPELMRDQYWDEVFPTELLHTAASLPFRELLATSSRRLSRNCNLLP